MFIRVICFSLVFTLIQCKLLRNDEICGDFDGRRMYLELNEGGILEAHNPKQSNYKVKDASHKQCSIELITCPSCIVTIKFTFLNISRNCGKKSVVDSCGCDYVWIYEPSFEEVSGEQFCGHFIETNKSSLVYKTQTRSVSITFLYSNFNQHHAFTLEYMSERNKHQLVGYPKYSKMNNDSQHIVSPFFPNFYPRDLNMEYVINCVTTEPCRIRLIFTDFQVSQNSLIEFFDWNGQRMHVTTGVMFRPPLLISSGPSMMIRFYANGGTNLGFKANYMFLLGDKDNSTMRPVTDCGGFVDNLGGRITMMDMVEEGTKSFDCFWIIRPPESFLHLKTQLYLKINTFSDFAGSTELTVRQGMTSKEPIIEILRHPVSQYVMTKQKERIVPISQGFYVSLKGLFRSESRLAIVYSAFNYEGCFSHSEFLCRNLRCIPIYLSCDGFDHCGDNSDETANCLKESKERLKWSTSPNFFFPKMERFSYLKSATIVFVVCSLGLISLIFILIILLYRINSRTRNQRQLQTHLQTINDMLVCTIILEENHGITEEEITIADDPPNYEAPPDYEEVLKLCSNLENKIRKRSTKSTTAPTPENSCICCMPTLDESTCKFIEKVAASDNVPGTSRSSQTTPIPPPPIPNSPPPLYSSLPKYKVSNVLVKAIEDVDSIMTCEIPIERASNEAEVTIPIIIQTTISGNNESQREQNADTILQIDDDTLQNIIVLRNDDSSKVEVNKKIPCFVSKTYKFASLQNVSTVILMKKRSNSFHVGNFKENLNIKLKMKKKALEFIPLDKKMCMSDSELLGHDFEQSFEATSSGSDDCFVDTQLRRSRSIENLFKIE